MPNVVSNVSLTGPIDPYRVQLQDIERRRALAEALQLQGARPLGETEVVGGWAIPRSHTEGLAKLSQALVGIYGQQHASQQEEALGKQYQGDLQNTLSRALLAGSPTPAMPENAPIEGEPGPVRPAMPASAGNQALMGQILMEHPGTQALGMQQISKDMEMQQRKALLAQALQAGGGAQSAQSGQPAAAGGGMFAGLPPQVTALMTSGDPELVKLGTTMMEANKGIAQRPGAPVVNPFTGSVIAQPTPTMLPGQQLTVGGGAGPQAATVPGFTQSQQELGQTPLQEVTNPDQTKSYIPKAQLAAAAQPGAAPAPGGPAVAGMRLNAPDDATARAWTLQLDAQGIPHTITVGAAPVPRGTHFNAPKFGQTQEEKITQERQTAGGKATDEAVGKDLAAFITGGAQDATKQLAQLQDVLGALQKPGSDMTGPIRGRMPDIVRNVTNPEAVAMRERVEEVVQRSLRAILGAQFTEKEGERLISRAYNPSQPPAENAIRVGRLYTQLQQALQQKTDLATYFQKNGTMQGWQGKLPTMADFDPAGGSAAGAATQGGKGGLTPQEQQELDQLRARFGRGR